jgi:hypothetical protein
MASQPARQGLLNWVKFFESVTNATLAAALHFAADVINNLWLYSLLTSHASIFCLANMASQSIMEGLDLTTITLVTTVFSAVGLVQIVKQNLNLNASLGLCLLLVTCHLLAVLPPAVPFPRAKTRRCFQHLVCLPLVLRAMALGRREDITPVRVGRTHRAQRARFLHTSGLHRYLLTAAQELRRLCQDQLPESRQGPRWSHMGRRSRQASQRG